MKEGDKETVGTNVSKKEIIDLKVGRTVFEGTDEVERTIVIDGRFKGITEIEGNIEGFKDNNGTIGGT